MAVIAGGEERSAKAASCWKKSCSLRTRAVKRRGESHAKSTSLGQISAIVRMMDSTAAAASGGTGDGGGGKAAIDVMAYRKSRRGEWW